MANVLYNSFKQMLLEPGTLGTTSGDAIDLASDNIKCLLIDTNVYVFSQTHNYHDDVVALGGIVATGTVNLAGVSVVAGVFDANNYVFSAVPGPTTVEAIIIYKDTGTSSTSSLIAYIDTAGGTLPVTPNGGDITVTWGANIFAL